MKSTFGSAVLLAAVSMFSSVYAVEHPLLTSTHDFEETWIEKPQKGDMIAQVKELSYTKFFDHSHRPVIGVLTEPLRGELFNAGANIFDKNQKLSSEENLPGYVPRAHVQFLEQAGVRVVPIDYRLSRDELVEKFDQINGLYLSGDS